jgi:dTDP-4-amino-4,6-dideoxygalactose transaminase
MKIREIPWTSLGGVYGQDDIDVVMQLLQAQEERSAGFFRLPEEPTFERAFAQHEGSQYASAVNSCGTGLDLAMRVLGIGPGDEVITTPLTFVATPHCVVGVGAKVVFADIDPLTYNLDPAKAEEKITPRTKAIIPVHMNGMPADIDGFTELSHRTGARVVYDAAHAVGVLFDGRKIGPARDMSVYSFQSNKNMSTLGEGGMITTDDAELHARLQRVKSFGFQYGETDDVLEWGTNYRLNKLQSAVGLTQLQKVDDTNRARHRFARYVSEALETVPEVIAPFDDGTHFCSYHLYMLRFNDEIVDATRDEFLAILKGRYKVAVTFHYPPLWNFSFYRDMGYGPEDTPVAAKVLRQLFNVPVFPRMQMEDFEYIVWALKQSVSDLKKGR